VLQKRLNLVSQRLAASPYLAGDAFTAADISVSYALYLGQRNCRLAYKRALERSHEGVGG